MEKSNKRKRDADYPRISYHTSTRTFDRLFKEESLAEMKEVARRKLGLSSTTPISFVQLREDKTVDLEDDDDFDAFYSLAHSTNLVNVRVSTGSLGNEPIAEAPMAPTIKRTKKLINRAPSNTPSEVDGGQAADDERDTQGVGSDEAVIHSPKVLSGAADARGPRKKKRKASMGDSVVDNMNNQPNTAVVPGAAPSGTGFAPLVDNVASTPTQKVIPPASQLIASNTQKKQKQRQLAEPPITEHLTTESVSVVEKSSKKKSTTKGSQYAAAVHSSEEIIEAVSEKSATKSLNAEEPTVSSKQPEAKKRKPKKRQSRSDRELAAKASNPTTDASIEEVAEEVHENDVANGNDENLSTRDTSSKKKGRRHTSEELRTAEADVEAAFTRILAANRAALAASVSVTPPVQQTVLGPTQKIKGKKRTKRTINSEAEGSRTEDCVDMPAPPSGAIWPSDSGPDNSTCPLCLLSPLHSRKKCPLVLGGPESLEQRLSEIQEASPDEADNRDEIIAEIRQLLALSKKDRETNISPQANRNLSQASFHQIQNLSISGKISNRPSGSQTKKVMPMPSPHIEDSDTSSEETSDGETPGETNVLPFVLNDAASLANINLDELIRGPNIPALRAADISSPDISEEEEEQVLEEEEEEAPRPSRKTGIRDSSDDTNSCSDDENSAAGEGRRTPTNDPKPDVLLGPGTEHMSFQAVDQLGESQEVDRSADTAFGAALAADTAVFNLTDSSQSIASSSQLPRNTSALASSRTQVTQASPNAETLAMTLPIATPMLPTEPPASQPIVSPTLTDPANSTSGSDTREENRPTGLVQRMRTRSGKNSNYGKPPVTPNATQTPRNRFTQASQEIPDSAVRRTRAATRRQTLGAMTPPVLTTSLGKLSRVIRESGSSKAIEGSNGVTASSNFQGPTSLDTWATLKPSSPFPDTDATMMVDELESSSSPLYTKMDGANPEEEGASQEAPTKDPLFILTESQPPFPYSQWNDAPQQQEAEHDPISNDSDDANEVEASVKRPQPKPSQTARYRRLTDITIDHGLFSTPANLRPARFSPLGNQLATDMYGRTGQEEIESESDSGSDDSDTQEQSHIPKSRRAGVTRNRRK
ncbi:hypothetical protein D9615_004537 [Tricholomella constricta]|uniref:Uncharacterized protein n=1 Tax=Tricholomella constricta TaxID=117010 RepID=A0A8H5HC52_9AGAR|nr:hypothetical protein D9615_004537 [Tricholomella constricta]